MKKLLRKICYFLPYPPVKCPNCGHFASPLGLRCEKCGEDLKEFY